MITLNELFKVLSSSELISVVDDYNYRHITTNLRYTTYDEIEDRDMPEVTVYTFTKHHPELLPYHVTQIEVGEDAELKLHIINPKLTAKRGTHNA